MRLCLQNVPQLFQTVPSSVDKGSSMGAYGNIFYIQTFESIWWQKVLFGVAFKSMYDSLASNGRYLYNLFLVVPWKILDCPFVLYSLWPPAKVLHSLAPLLAELPLGLQASCLHLI